MVITFDDLMSLKQKHQNQTVVLAGGCYDLLHVGHVNFLERCRALGDVLVVAVSSDLRIKERKGEKRPIIPEAERAMMVSALSSVDYGLVAPNPVVDNEPPSVQMIQTLRPAIFATSDPRYHEYANDAKQYGTTVVHVADVRLNSTTDIIARITSL